MMDDLILIYKGNQLTKVTDNAAASAYANGMEFKDGTNQAVEYNYDANGNMTKDLNKNIYCCPIKLLISYL